MFASPFSLAAIRQTAFHHSAGGRITAAHNRAIAVAGRRLLLLNAPREMAGRAESIHILLAFEDVTGTAREAAS